MNLHALYHRAKSNYCYCYDGKSIHIRFRAAKNDLDKVFLIYGDKYEWDKREVLSMELAGSDELYDYFTAEVIPPYRRLAYIFEVVKGSEKRYFTEWGAVKEINEKEIYQMYFQYPYLHNSDMHDTPEWVKDSVFYQIFPERFCNGDPEISPKNTEAWGKKPSSRTFFGGDLRGIIRKLDYLVDLGINALYLTPVFEAASNHKYDTTDYFKIDPCFGDIETFKELVKECHNRGIRVMLDAVFNHCGFFFKPFQDVLRKGKESQYFDWFHIHGEYAAIEPLNYDAFAFVPNMPKLNTQNPEVREYLLKAARYWIEEADIDGWRLDVSDEVDHEFWRAFRKTVKAAKKDAYILGELWLNSLPWLMGDQFDAVMNYPFTRNCLHYFVYQRISTKQLRESITKLQMDHMQQVNEVMFNLLDSHDTPRFLTLAEGDKSKLKLAAAFQFTFSGAPCIYYGTEIGMEGAGDPDCRRTMQWDEQSWDKELRSYYKKLISLRKKHNALRRGSLQWIDCKDDVLAYIRETPEEKIFVFINNNDTDSIQIVNIECDTVVDILNEEVLNTKNGELTFNIGKKSARIFNLLSK